MNAPQDEGPAPGVQPVRALRVTSDGAAPGDDRLVVEAPLEIVLHHSTLGDEGASFGTTLRTPGADEDLAVGLLYGEGIVDSWADVERLESSTRRANLVSVRLRAGAPLVRLPPSRRFSAGSSCGVCGVTSFDDVLARAARTRVRGQGRTSLRVLRALPAAMRNAQPAFAQTGGIHASALFDLEGGVIDLAEDIGRHNALDKLIGRSLRGGRLPLTDRIVLLSGRASFELAQKAIRAGVSLLVAIGAPSSLAVTLSEQSGMTLVGFLRDDRCNVYAHPQRIEAHGATE
jgi:FdhD protein